MWCGGWGNNLGLLAKILNLLMRRTMGDNNRCVGV